MRRSAALPEPESERDPLPRSGGVRVLSELPEADPDEPPLSAPLEGLRERLKMPPEPLEPGSEEPLPLPRSECEPEPDEPPLPRSDRDPEPEPDELPRSGGVRVLSELPEDDPEEPPESRDDPPDELPDEEPPLDLSLPLSDLSLAPPLDPPLEGLRERLTWASTTVANSRPLATLKPKVKRPNFNAVGKISAFRFIAFSSVSSARHTVFSVILYDLLQTNVIGAGM